MTHQSMSPESMTRLKGRVALVTGAQQGIGRAMALAFAREGADVVVNYLDDAGAAEQVAAQARKSGGRALVVQADVARVDQGQALIARAVEELGGLDVLVNNAGVYPRSPFLDLSEREWDYVLDVNLKGSCFCAQAAARALIAGRRRGSIINLSSSPRSSSMPASRSRGTGGPPSSWRRSWPCCCGNATGARASPRTSSSPCSRRAARSRACGRCPPTRSPPSRCCRCRRRAPSGRG